MQTPDQSPEEIQQQPLYEFSTDNTLQSATKDSVEERALQEGFPSPHTSSSQVQPEEKGAADEQLPSAEAIRQGLIYPPPPTFYQTAQIEPARPPLLPPAPMYTVSPGYVPSQQGYFPGPSLVGQPFVPIPPPVKKSRRWIWIVVSILSIALLAACTPAAASAPLAVASAGRGAETPWSEAMEEQARGDLPCRGKRPRQAADRARITRAGNCRPRIHMAH